jgi:ectoine hydroxylase-related dioxygenase (phytanoyl-CoA dioxygenase family)
MTSSPVQSYGVLERTQVASSIDLAVEEISRVGFCVFDSGFSKSTIANIADHFDRMHAEYLAHHGLEYMRSRDEHNTVRLPLSLDNTFLDLARTKRLLELVSRLIAGKFILNQQNGIVNPVNSRYNQDAWHRDLPYQHFTSSRPIAVNALYCIDEFTIENGATSVLPGTHLHEAFPSDAFIEKNARQIPAPAGSFIVIDGMTYHRGEKNHTAQPRRAVNHVFTIPFIKQQIAIPPAMNGDGLDEATRDLLGYRYATPASIDEFLKARS